MNYLLFLYPKGYTMPIIYRNSISGFVKDNRVKLNMTQQDLAAKAGVGLRFIRELEQGKETLRLDKVNQVLQLFGYTLSPTSAKEKDPYDILFNHFNKSVHIFLKDRRELWGILIEEIRDGNQIKAWRFVSNNNAIKYQKKEDPKLVMVIDHEDIENIENI
jgi:y4mF family transcriptional regulator